MLKISVLMILILYKRKLVKVGNKTLNQHFGANLKNRLFAKFCIKFVPFYVFQLFCIKMLKMTISTKVWGAQNPNACWNIQPQTIEGGWKRYLLTRGDHIKKPIQSVNMLIFISLGKGDCVTSFLWVALNKLRENF